MLKLCEMIWVDKGVGVDKVFWEIMEPLYTVVDHSKVEMLRYILQSLIRVSNVLLQTSLEWNMVKMKNDREGRSKEWKENGPGKWEDNEEACTKRNEENRARD